MMSRLGGLVVIGVLAVSASGADRVVFFEDFNATWCGPCHVAGTYIKQLSREHPDTLVVGNPHIGDGITLPYSWTRANTLGYGGYIPYVTFDARWSLTGAYGYDTYKMYYESCLLFATDIKVEIGAALVQDKTFNFTVRATMDPNGTARDVRIFLVRCLDNYPEPPPPYDPYQNTYMEWGTPEYKVVSVSPGRSSNVSWSFTFDDYSWSRQSDIRMIAWAEENSTTWPREVYNAKKVSYPFSGLGKKGDLNCDDSINFADINPFVLALSDPDEYKKQFPNCDINNGDCNEDGQINFADINKFVELLTR